MDDAMHARMTYAATRMDLDKLSTADLATFHVCLGWPEPRAACEARPWFSVVATLFTEDGGRRIHPDVLAAIDTIVQERLGL